MRRFSYHSGSCLHSPVKNLITLDPNRVRLELNSFHCFPRRTRREKKMADASKTHRDPVCGMTVNPAKAAGSREHLGHTYYFCGAGCVAKFTAEPDRYVKPPEPAAPLPPGTQPAEYTCPMHPEVRQMGPGACPKCGMALEPVAISAQQEDNPELA